MKKSNLTRSLMAACSIVALSAVMYGCSSSGKDSANMRADDAEAALAALNEAAMDQLGEGETLTPETYAAIIAKAAADKAEALRMAGEAADADKAEALRMAGEAADADKAEALRMAGEAADADKAEALRMAGEAADADKAEALRMAGEAADADKAEALRMAGEAADADKAEALRMAGEAADADKAEALRMAGEAADADKAEALRMAGEAADADKAEALRMAGEAADADKAEALRMAGEAADADKAEALRMAGEAADADKAEALRMAGEAADADKAEALRMAGEAAAADKAEALRMAGEAAAADKAEALRMAGEAADADKAEALRMAGEAADADKAEALRMAGEAADADKAEALRMAGEAADADKAEALRMAGEAADADKAEALRMAGEAADADKAEALRMAGEAADADKAEALRLAGEAADADKAEALRLAAEQAEMDEKAAVEAALEPYKTQADAFATAQNARDDATGAADAAEKAVTTATAASAMITTLPAAGDSAAAEVNAQSVLNAKTTADNAVTTAEQALADAKTALANVDADAENADSLTRALEAAIKVVEAELEKAKMEAESAALKAAVELVTGDDPDVEGYPMTPAQHGRAVAMDIDGALSPTTVTNGARARGTHGDTAPTMTTDPMETAVKMNDHQGMTWEEVVGAANVNDMRVDRGEGTKVVKAASFAGMPLSSITGSPPTAGDEVTDGTEYETANYMGIPGTVFCASTDCKVEDVDGVDTLTGSWYFTPTDGDEWYIGTTTAGVTAYAPETLYARFGHWLADTNVDDNAEVNTYAMTGGNTSGIDVTTVNTGAEATTLTDTSASYRGPAAGMSVHQTTDSDGMITDMDSAAFTATVNLKATFGASPTLGGTVTDFQGNATDPSWSVELQVTGFDSGASTVTDGRTVASGRDGLWTATAYGESGARPTGIFGGFNAHFTDGHAAGAYATRK